MHTAPLLAPLRRPALLAVAAVLALLVSLLPTAASADEIDLTSYRNNVGICHHPLHQCNFDGGNFSYSLAALLLEGVQGGSTVEADGFTFTWPDSAAGEPDNVEMNGQLIPVLPGASTRIGFLAAGHNAPVTANLRLHYTDVTEAGELVDVVVTEPLVLSDWTLNAGSASPSAGNQTVISTRFRVNGSTVEQVRTHVFVASVDIDPDMTLQSIEFPQENRAHVFGLDLQ